ncbi:MAG TPA: MBL fold metallo-hydrolase [Acidobacteriota bacterium]|nr:MBL fold metallo-hydrolase [Acidobacteriota bacterium]HQP74389.1 MBL fold metallo-hydrolase [Acidobacteriota bacterium]
MVFQQIAQGRTRNFAYLFASRPGGSGFAVDPGPDAVPDGLLDMIRDLKVNVSSIILTHHHADHVAGTTALVAATGASVHAHAETARLLSGRVRVDRCLADGGALRWEDDLAVEVLATPGHAPGSICLVVNDAWLVTGDSLFIGDCGRTDLPGGDAAALFRSLQRLKGLPDHLAVCPGHDYGPVPIRRLGEEKDRNPALQAADLAAFKAIP